jgi:hypothetical protein
MTDGYLVSPISGPYPQELGTSGLIYNSPGGVFNSQLDAEDWIAQQYDSFSLPYPAVWYTIQKVDIVKPPTTIATNYPSLSGQVPNSPTNFTATTDTTSFTFSWDAPTNLQGAPDTTYTVTVITSWGMPGYGINLSPTSGTSVTVPGTAITTPEAWFIYAPFEEIPPIPYGVECSFFVEAQNVFGSSGPGYGYVPSVISNTVTGYGLGIPAIPVNMTVTSATPATVTWDQPYPSGAGIPTSWLLISNASGGTVATVTTSGTPTTGSATISSTVAGSGVLLIASNAQGTCMPVLGHS